MLANSPSKPQGAAQDSACLVADHLNRTTLSFRPAYLSVLEVDADGLGKEILENAAPHLSVGLHVDWLETQRIGGGMYLSHIRTKFRENHPNALTSLAIVDPLPIDYEPLLRRMLEHFEKPGLERILMSVGVICEDWISQLLLDIDSEDLPDLSGQALAIVPDGFDLSPFRAAIEPWLRKPLTNRFPNIVRAKVY